MVVLRFLAGEKYFRRVETHLWIGGGEKLFCQAKQSTLCD
jgi:hypothetical protein